MFSLSRPHEVPLLDTDQLLAVPVDDLLTLYNDQPKRMHEFLPLHHAIVFATVLTPIYQTVESIDDISIETIKAHAYEFLIPYLQISAYYRLSNANEIYQLLWDLSKTMYEKLSTIYPKAKQPGELIMFERMAGRSVGIFRIFKEA